MKRITSVFLALFLMLSLTPAALAETAETSGSPEFIVTTVITPGATNVYPGGTVEFTALTTYTTNKTENQWLHFVSDEWSGADSSVSVIPSDDTDAAPAAELPGAVLGSSNTEAEPYDRLSEFTSTAAVVMPEELGWYNVYITYSITLRHDASEMRTYVSTVTWVGLIQVVEDTRLPEDLPLPAEPTAEPLNPETDVETPENAGSPVFDVTTVINPSITEVYNGEKLEFSAVTTYDSNKTDNQLLHFVSDGWTGVDSSIPAAGSNERRAEFISYATVNTPVEPGPFEVTVTYTITLRHDVSGIRTYVTTVTWSGFIEIMDGIRPVEGILPVTEQTGEALNHGQIVSAWAHWKQTKGNKNFLAGGPGVSRSLVWYKNQVEYLTFYSFEEVWLYLDSIYIPQTRNNQNNGNDHQKKDKKDD